MLGVYNFVTGRSGGLLRFLLKNRLGKGKEDPERIKEREALTSLPRPEGKIVWVHAASVGEAQSALILIDAILDNYSSVRVLITSGTVTSAKLMASRLPERSFHQYYPLDHPAWVSRFLDHWKPDAVLWIESELWPNMLSSIKKRRIPTIMINGRMSPSSFSKWRYAKKLIASILSVFDACLVQTDVDKNHLLCLGVEKITVTDNLKYSAAPLPCDDKELCELQDALKERKVWLYASSHDGEEALACHLHKNLRKDFPELLTIILPRHPERRKEVYDCCMDQLLNAKLRSETGNNINKGDDIYIADTLGELGLFYRLAPVSCIGRSFSSDGGGGHNPIEAAQLGCAVLHGPKVQNLQEIFTQMDATGAAIQLNNENEFEEALRKCLCDDSFLKDKQSKALDFASRKSAVIDIVMEHITPTLDKVLKG